MNDSAPATTGAPIWISVNVGFRIGDAKAHALSFAMIASAFRAYGVPAIVFLDVVRVIESLPADFWIVNYLWRVWDKNRVH